MKVVIIGGVAGGATAAARLRRLSEDAQIIIIERTGFISYANCGMPYYVGGVIEEKKKLTLQTPESFWSRFQIDARVKHEALAIDRERKCVSIKELCTGRIYEESYDTLILSPGAYALKPAIPGIESPRVYTLKNTEDAFALRDEALRNKGKRAVVVGGGFIGIECAENLKEAGMETTLVEATSHILPTIDKEMASLVEREMRENGVTLKLGASVTAIDDKGSFVEVALGDEKIEAAFVVMAAGVRPDSKLAIDADLETDERGSIITDDQMRTSDKSIYAVGDAVKILNKASGRMSMIALAGPANKEGRIAADNIAGIPSHYRGATAASIVKVFSISAASGGISEESAKKLGIEIEKVYTFQGDHASYYPGSEMMMVKAIFEKDSWRLLGFEIVGKKGVDKRADVMSLAIAHGMDAEDLASFDAAYAPPYSSAKDPVNIVGMIASNRKLGLLEEYFAEDIPSIDGILVDLRTKKEVEDGMIDGAINIPLDELRDHLDELDKSKTIYVYCRSGQRSYIGARILQGHGFKAKSLSGGYLMYKATEGK